jgi:hypothetical protein
VREAYIAERRLRDEMRHDAPSNYLPATQWDGGRATRFDKTVYVKPIWPKIAKVVLDNHIDPVAYVRVQFAQKSMSSPDPQPNHLLGPKALERYRRAYPEQAMLQRTRDAFEHQKTALSVAVTNFMDLGDMTDEQIFTAVVCSSQLPFTPLFRYCLAHQVKRPQLAERYFEDAAFEFCLQPKLYANVWGDWIPDGFATLAVAHVAVMQVSKNANNDDEGT